MSYRFLRETKKKQNKLSDYAANNTSRSPAVLAQYLLTDCTRFSAARQRYRGVYTLKELFENVKSRNIVAFIKDTNFYHCI